MSDSEKFCLQVAVAIAFALSECSDEAAEPVIKTARQLLKDIRTARQP
jgi:hypothetical protein